MESLWCICRLHLINSIFTHNKMKACDYLVSITWFLRICNPRTREGIRTIFIFSKTISCTYRARALQMVTGFLQYAGEGSSQVGPGRRAFWACFATSERPELGRLTSLSLGFLLTKHQGWKGVQKVDSNSRRFLQA